MDTSRQIAVVPKETEVVVAPQRQRRSIAEKRRIVEETLVPGASVARVARAHGVNANQVFGWRRLYQVGRLGGVSPTMKLLRVHVSEPSVLATVAQGECSHAGDQTRPQPTAIHIKLRQAEVRIEGSADPVLVRVLLKCLRA